MTTRANESTEEIVLDLLVREIQRLDSQAIEERRLRGHAFEQLEKASRVMRAFEASSHRCAWPEGGPVGMDPTCARCVYEAAMKEKP